jgi:predicted transposase/invertase (TIGR01784 family)
MTLSITYEQIESEILERGRQEGREEGWEEGQANAQRAIVLNMRQSGLGLDQIAQLTGLTPEAVQGLSVQGRVEGRELPY